MGLEIGPHCTPTFEGFWLCFIDAFAFYKALAPDSH